MLKKTSPEFRKFFLKNFTKALIENSSSIEFLRLEKTIQNSDLKQTQNIEEEFKTKEFRDLKQELDEKTKPNLKEIIKRPFKRITKKQNVFPRQRIENKQQTIPKNSIQKNKISQIQKKPLPSVPKNIPQKISMQKTSAPPQNYIPQALKEISPTPNNKKINLGILNKLINDSAVKVIECSGPGKNILVKGLMGIKKTDIILGEEGIEQVIDTFSKATRIPKQEGIYKVIYGNLLLTAILSEIINSKFTIKKLTPQYTSQLPLPKYNNPSQNFLPQRA